MRAADFINTLGVGTQLGNPGNRDAGRIDGMLDYLGTSNVRQSAPGDAASSNLLMELGRLGAKFDLIINGNGPVNLPNVLNTIATYRPYLNAVEGPNEVDIFPLTYTTRGVGGIEGAQLLQEDMYRALRADRAYDGIDIYTFSLANILPATNPAIRDMSDFADAASVHSYAPRGLRPAWVIPYGIDGFDDIARRDPAVLTETGYYTLPSNRAWGGVTENVQAQYTLDTVFGNAMRGVERTYLFNLIDQPDPANTEREAHFGLFRTDYSAKPAAAALHNVTTILADNGANASSFTTRDVGYSVSGLPFTQASMQLQKSDGTHVIAVWNEEALWNSDAATEIASPRYNTTVSLDRAYDVVRVYDPLLSADPIATYFNTSAVTTQVASHPVLIQLGNGTPAPAPAAPAPAPAASAPVVAPAPAPVTAPPAATTPAGSTDTLVLTVSEDAWNGDARFTVQVDGTQVGGPYVATALRSQGKTQDFTLTGDWTDGAHRVTVTFINDTFGGTPSTDRNLYVEKVTFNGAAATPSSPVSLLGPEPADFTVGVGRALVLRMAEDAYRGDAQFTVKVDGVQVGGVNTVTASHAAGRTQDFAFAGSWATGQHRVTVDFLNDAHGGTAATDRNLYVDSIELGGTQRDGGVIYTGSANYDIFG